MKRTAVIAALALAACALVEPQSPPAPVVEPRTPAPAVPAIEPRAPAPVVPAIEPDESRVTAELVGYYQRVAGLGLEDQKRELAAATQAFNRERTNANRVRLALLYAIPGSAIQDDARAAQLLEPIAGGGGAVRQLAGLVSSQVNDRMKTQKRADQAKDQLEQLREIEKQLIERGGQATPPRKP